MIRISVSDETLRKKVREKDRNWDKHTDPTTRHWPKVKDIFLDIQHHKCCYCETDIGGRVDKRTNERCRSVQDVEHFRPKSEVVSWNFPSNYPDPPTLGVGPEKGYPWLTHNEFNFAASCKTCNIDKKKCYFPILKGHPDYTTSPTLEELKSEEPLLVFPLGDSDKDPEKLVTFMGWDAVPHWEANSTEYWRAVATIELLDLNRVDLLHQRRQMIASLARSWAGIREASQGYAEPKAEFSSCAKAFLTLCANQPNVALELAKQAHAPLDKTPSPEATAIYRATCQALDRAWSAV